MMAQNTQNSSQQTVQPNQFSMFPAPTTSQQIIQQDSSKQQKIRQDNQLSTAVQQYNNQFDDNQMPYSSQSITKIENQKGIEVSQPNDQIMVQVVISNKQDYAKQIVKNVIDRSVKTYEMTPIKKREIKKKIKNKSILDQRQAIIVHVPVNLKQIEDKIKQIAKLIRLKVKKDQKVIPSKELTKTKKRGQLNNLTQPNINFITTPRDITVPEPTKLLLSKHNNKMIIRQLLQSSVLDKVDRQINLHQKIKRKTLKLDPIKHHKYPITSFRRSILVEQQILHEQSSKRSKQKQEKLMQRKEIFNNSRYERYRHIIKKQNSKRNVFIEQSVRQNQQQAIKEYSVENPQAKQQTAVLSQQQQPNFPSLQMSEKKDISQVQPIQNQNYEEEEYDQDF